MAFVHHGITDCKFLVDRWCWPGASITDAIGEFLRPAVDALKSQFLPLPGREVARCR